MTNKDVTYSHHVTYDSIVSDHYLVRSCAIMSRMGNYSMIELIRTAHDDRPAYIPIFTIAKTLQKARRITMNRTPYITLIFCFTLLFFIYVQSTYKNLVSRKNHPTRSRKYHPCMNGISLLGFSTMVASTYLGMNQSHHFCTYVTMSHGKRAHQIMISTVAF